MENQGKSCAVLAGVSELAAQIEISREIINKTQQRLAEMRQKREAVSADIQEARAFLEQLQAEESAAVRNLAQARKDEAEQHFQNSAAGQALARSQSEKLAALDEEAVNLDAALTEAQKAAELKAEQSRDALAVFSVRQQESRQLAGELAAQHQLLQEELAQIRRQLNETVKAAGAKDATARIELEAAEISLRTAEKALADISAALKLTEEEIDRRQSELEQLYRMRQFEQETERRRNDQVLNQVRQAEEVLAQQHRLNQEEVEKARSLATISSSALTGGEERLLRLTRELQDLYASTQEEARVLSDRMESVLKHAFSERQAYTKILAVATGIKTQAQEAEEYENQLTERVNLLSRESQNLSNAALVAKNLAADATIAKANASRDMFYQVDEMERALIAAADEAEHLAARKQTDLLEAQNALAAVFGNAVKKRQAAAEAQKLLTEAAQNCLAAEQEMLNLTTSVETNCGDHSFTSQQIKERQAAYQEAVAEVRELREAALTAGNHYRLLRVEAEKTERAYISAAGETARVTAACEKEALEAEERITARIAQSQSQLAMAKEKRDKLIQAKADKELAVDKCRDLLALKTERSQAVAEEYQAVKAAAEENFAALQSKLDANLAQDRAYIEAAEEKTDAAYQDYQQALDQAAQAAEAINAAQALVAAGKARREALLAGHEEQTRLGLEQAQAAAAAKAAQVSYWQEALAQLENPICIARLELASRRKRAGAAQAGLEALSLRLDHLQGDLDLQEAGYQALRAAEEQRQAEEARALLAAEAEEQARRFHEEELARLKAEQEKQRIAEELEAAHIRAEAEMAAVAQEKAEQEAAAEAEAMQLAAGQVLTNADNLALITSGQLKARMKRLETLSREEAQALAQRQITKDEAEELAAAAKAAQAEAKIHLQLFRSAQTTLNSLSVRLDESQTQRRQAGREWARCIAALDHASFEQDALSAACRQTELSGFTSSQSSYKLLNKAMRHLHKAVAENQNIIKRCQTALQRQQDQVRELDTALQKVRQERQEAEALLAEIIGKWIFKERLAMKTTAMLKAMHLFQEGLEADGAETAADKS